MKNLASNPRPCLPTGHSRWPRLSHLLRVLQVGDRLRLSVQLHPEPAEVEAARLGADHEEPEVVEGAADNQKHFSRRPQSSHVRGEKEVHVIKLFRVNLL